MTAKQASARWDASQTGEHQLPHQLLRQLLRQLLHQLKGTLCKGFNTHIVIPFLGTPMGVLETQGAHAAGTASRGVRHLRCLHGTQRPVRRPQFHLQAVELLGSFLP